MQLYILKRLAQGLLVLFVSSLLVFFLTRMTGNPIDLLAGDQATVQEREALAKSLGLNEPIHVQYYVFVSNILHGDFGRSLFGRRPVSELIMERLPATLQLALASMLLSILIAIPIGVYSAVWRGSPFDVLGKIVAVFGQSVPPFWLGLILILIFAVMLHWLPSGGKGDDLRYLVLPTINLGWAIVAGIMRLTRSSMLETLDTEYVKLARLKGLSEWKVVWKHGVKNALIPVITYSMIVFASLLNGAMITEAVFSWPGVGRLLVDAVARRDFPIVQAVALLSTAVYVFASLFADILYAKVNPKVRA